LLKVEDGHGQLRAWHAWRDDAPAAVRRDARWVEDYRRVLEESVRTRLTGDPPLGSENSGGLDSATVTAFAARLLGEPGDRLHSFGFALHELEPQLILATSLASGIVHNHVITNRLRETMDAARVRALRVIGYPEASGSALAHTPFYDECERWGIRTLLSGFGGDQVVSNAGTHLYWELTDAGRWVALWEVLPGSATRRGLRVAKRAAVRHRMPVYDAGLLETVRRGWPLQLLRAEVAQRLDVHAEMLEKARFTTPYRRINDLVLHRHLAGANVPVRLESCTLLAASYGVEYRWPLWDARLVQQYLSTPSIEKLGPQGVSRYLHRRAVDGVVPRRIVWRRGKAIGPALARQGAESPMNVAFEQANILADTLHPTLDELVDRGKLREQIARAARASADDAFAFHFVGNVHRIARLQDWLEDTAPP
jgi:asparagine synthase (glutamine-hydrolysing)